MIYISYIWWWPWYNHDLTLVCIAVLVVAHCCHDLVTRRGHYKKGWNQKEAYRPVYHVAVERSSTPNGLSSAAVGRGCCSSSSLLTVRSSCDSMVYTYVLSASQEGNEGTNGRLVCVWARTPTTNKTTHWLPQQATLRLFVIWHYYWYLFPVMCIWCVKCLLLSQVGRRHTIRHHT